MFRGTISTALSVTLIAGAFSAPLRAPLRGVGRESSAVDSVISLSTSHDELQGIQEPYPAGDWHDGAPTNTQMEGAAKATTEDALRRKPGKPGKKKGGPAPKDPEDECSTDDDCGDGAQCGLCIPAGELPSYACCIPLEQEGDGKLGADAVDVRREVIVKGSPLIKKMTEQANMGAEPEVTRRSIILQNAKGKHDGEVGTKHTDGTDSTDGSHAEVEATVKPKGVTKPPREDDPNEPTERPSDHQTYKWFECETDRDCHFTRGHSYCCKRSNPSDMGGSCELCLGPLPGGNVIQEYESPFDNDDGGVEDINNLRRTRSASFRNTGVNRHNDLGKYSGGADGTNPKGEATVKPKGVTKPPVEGEPTTEMRPWGYCETHADCPEFPNYCWNHECVKDPRASSDFDPIAFRNRRKA